MAEPLLPGTFEARLRAKGYSLHLLGHCISTCGMLGHARPCRQTIIHTYIHAYIHTYITLHYITLHCIKLHCMYVCMYVCMYARTYVCMFVCMYVCLYTFKLYTSSTAQGGGGSFRIGKL